MALVDHILLREGLEQQEARAWLARGGLEQHEMVLWAEWHAKSLKSELHDDIDLGDDTVMCNVCSR